jgi:predicted AlkP superfamily phosphohydrolase/phosphomutase
VRENPKSNCAFTPGGKASNLARQMATSPRVLLIGLDGATWRVLDPMIAAGRLPALAALRARGRWGVLESIVPPVTAPAWTSFFTGRNPGKHGIFNFTAARPGAYENLRLVTTRDIRCETLWDLLSAAGKAVGVMNVPMSYPVWPINGFMVSCMCTPRSVGVATHPPELAARLVNYQTSERRRIRTPIGAPGYREEAMAYLDEIARVTEQHGRVARELMASRPCDLFAVVFMTLDRMSHFFWRYLCPDGRGDDPEIAARVVAIVQALDAAVGQLVADAGTEATTFVVSDHGFGPDMTRAVNLHRLFLDRGWLAREQFWFAKRIGRKALLKLGGAEARYSFDKKAGVIDWSRTRAWVELAGPRLVGVRVNRAEVYGNGIVGDAEVAGLLADITETLGGLKDDDGSPLVREVKVREEVFSGPHASAAPDLVVFLHPPYTLVKSVGKALRSTRLVAPIPKPVRDGNHDPAGIYLAAGPAIETTGKGKSHSLMSVAPTILALFGVPAPADMDGEVMTDVLKPGAALATRQAAASGGASREEFQYSREDEEEIRARLENLGYLE